MSAANVSGVVAVGWIRRGHPAGHARSTIRRPRGGIARRHIQIALGCLWLLDGVLQFQPFMYTRGFLTQIIQPTISGQPAPIASSMTWVVHVTGAHPVFFNTCFALIQVAIGVGLLALRTVRLALAVSFVWGLGVWWFGEGFGQLLTSASPLTGAPGAVLLYVVIGVLVWPTEREDPSVAESGPFGALGAKVAWAVIWIGMAALWLLPDNRSANAFRDVLDRSASQSGGVLSGLIGAVSRLTTGNGTEIAAALAMVSALIGLGVFTRHRAIFLGSGAVISAAYWMLGQAFGDIATGTATDPNAGLLYVVLAASVAQTTGASRPGSHFPGGCLQHPGSTRPIHT